MGMFDTIRAEIECPCRDLFLKIDNVVKRFSARTEGEETLPFELGPKTPDELFDSMIQDEEHADLLKWAGEEFDPDHFDAEEFHFRDPQE